MRAAVGRRGGRGEEDCLVYNTPKTTEPEYLTFKERRIDSNESIPPAYVALRAGTTTQFLLGSYSHHKKF
jgi:hypothetical protein